MSKETVKEAAAEQFRDTISKHRIKPRIGSPDMISFELQTTDALLEVIESANEDASYRYSLIIEDLPGPELAA